MGGAELREQFEFAFTYAEGEYVSAARAFLWRRRDPKFERVLMGVFFATVVAIFVLAGDPYLGGMMATFMLAVLAVGYLMYRLQPRSYVPREPQLHEPFRVSLAEEYVRVVTTNFEATYDWKFFPKLVETPEFFFFVVDEERYFLLPKRATRGAREPALRELLRRKFGAKIETSGLPESAPHEFEREYVPPSEPPDWR